MNPDQQQYFYEHVWFPLLIDWRQTTAALKLINAGAERNPDVVRKLCFLAFDDLKTLEVDISARRGLRSKIGIAKPGSGATKAPTTFTVRMNTREISSSSIT